VPRPVAPPPPAVTEPVPQPLPPPPAAGVMAGAAGVAGPAGGGAPGFAPEPHFTPAVYTPATRKTSRWAWWALGAVALAVVAAGATYLATRSSGSQTTAPTTALAGGSTTLPGSKNSVTTTTNPAASESAQANTVAGLVSQSESARANLGNAISAIGSCGDITGAVATLQSDAATRDTLATAVASLDVSSVPNGSLARSDFQQAMQFSAQSDRNYAAWGNYVLATGSCQGTAPQDANWSAAQRSDTQATQAKTAFVAVWNPEAQKLGLAMVQANQF